MANVKAIEIRDANGLVDWLGKLSRNTSDQLARIIAGRVMLRQLPSFNGELTFQLVPDFWFVIFRTMLFLRLHPYFGNRLVVGLAAINFVASQKFQKSKTDTYLLHALLNSMTLVQSDRDIVKLALEIINSVQLDKHVDPETLWKSIRSDCEFFENENDIASFEFLPLWLQPATRKWQEDLSELRQYFAMDHLAVERWGVWLDWYQAVVDGRGCFELPRQSAQILEFRILMGNNHDDFWDRRPSIINAEIASWVEEARQSLTSVAVVESAETSDTVEATVTANDLNSLEPQNPLVATFTYDVGKTIDLDTTNGEGAVALTRNNRDGHAEVSRLSKQVLVKLKDAASANNGDALLVPELELFLNALGSKLETLRPAMLIPRGESLRQKLAAELDVRRIIDRPMSDGTRDALGVIVAAYNMFVSLDKALSDRDLALLGPDAKQNLVRPSIIVQLVLDAQNAKVITAAAAAAPIEAAKVAPAGPDPSNRGSLTASETFKNLARAVFGFLKLTWKTGAFVSTVAIAAATWALKYEGLLLQTFSNHPTMFNAIKTIIEFLKKLPISF